MVTFAVSVAVEDLEQLFELLCAGVSLLHDRGGHVLHLVEGDLSVAVAVQKLQLVAQRLLGGVDAHLQLADHRADHGLHHLHAAVLRVTGAFFTLQS